MSYASFLFYVFLLPIIGLYYIVPIRFRWSILLIGSGYFYYIVCKDYKICLILVSTILISYFWSILICRLKDNNSKGNLKKLILAIAIITSALPLIISKMSYFVLDTIIQSAKISWIIPVGLSFYTLQIIAYLFDVYHGKICPPQF